MHIRRSANDASRADFIAVCLRILASLTFNGQSRSKPIGAYSDLLQICRQVLRTFAEHRTVCCITCDLLANLCVENDDFKVAVHDAGLIPLASNAIKKFSLHEKTQKYGTTLIKCLLDSEKQCEQIRSAVVNAKGLPILASVRDSFRDHELIQANTKICIENVYFGTPLSNIPPMEGGGTGDDASGYPNDATTASSSSARSKSVHMFRRDRSRQRSAEINQVSTAITADDVEVVCVSSSESSQNQQPPFESSRPLGEMGGVDEYDTTSLLHQHEKAKQTTQHKQRRYRARSYPSPRPKGLFRKGAVLLESYRATDSEQELQRKFYSFAALF
eukprot:scaffold742_cov165-Amphora_coffeaeformis.AAC.4